MADQQLDSGLGAIDAFRVPAQRRWEVLDTGSKSGLRSTGSTTPIFSVHSVAFLQRG
jgi:hypothetical protein